MEHAALPTLVVIGAMKCGTTALHRYLDAHPDIAMSEPKELNFFFGPDAEDGLSGDDAGGRTGADGWREGNWHRGVRWYASQFDAGAALRGESSPGYSSPSHLEVAPRMAALLPDVRLLYLVRDPIARAVSQYHHHAAEGTDRRPIDEALLDPGSQYISRGRYHERLRPFLQRFPAEHLLIVAAEELALRRRAALRRVHSFLGVDHHWTPTLAQRHHIRRGNSGPTLSRCTAALLREAFAADAEDLRRFAGREFPGWTV